MGVTAPLFVTNDGEIPFVRPVRGVAPVNGLDFVTKAWAIANLGGSGPVLWGEIDGTLSSQSDLVAALDDRVLKSAGAFDTAPPTSAVAASTSTQLVRQGEVSALFDSTTALFLALLDGKQDLGAMLTALEALTTSANQMLYFTGSDAPALTGLSAFARTILDDADDAAVRATIGAAGSGDIPTIPEGVLYRMVPIHATAGSNIRATNVPEAARFMANSYFHMKLADLQGCSEVRLSCLCSSAATSGSSPRLIGRFHTAYTTSFGTTTNIGTSGAEVSCSVASLGIASSGWVGLHASAAIESCYLSIGEAGGDSSTAYSVRSVWLEFR